ncbi:N-acetyltransferase [Nocardioides panacisoli]|uniref:GNAT family N-acetyltransferase n=1 Tax=Nocardioides panacisoli TaxID=627624 RepID=UPI001C625155|nr:GNAT family N-acetyltransferase [Nocardioides panacisoli]QYJ03063.1 N-acetyltransferase [Nocardioides panacisoli]
MSETSTDVAVRDNPDRSRYEILLADEVVGFSAYQLADRRVTLAHVEVDPAHGGRGLASHLVRAQLDDAAQRGHEVVPVCPFVRKTIADHPDRYLDLVPRGERARFGLPDQD